MSHHWANHKGVRIPPEILARMTPAEMAKECGYKVRLRARPEVRWACCRCLRTFWGPEKLLRTGTRLCERCDDD